MVNEKENYTGYVYKCGGIPFYPEKHLFYKQSEGVSEDYTKKRRLHIKKFLN